MPDYYTARYERGEKRGTWRYTIYAPDGKENCHGARKCSKEEIEAHLEKVCKRANADIRKSGESWRYGDWNFNAKR